MARRQSYLAKRVQKMRGLPSEEKQLLLRVGELVDSAINNRTPTNPSEPGRNRVDPRLPPPTVITNETGVRSAKLTWPAVDSSILNHYKIIVTSLEEGTSEEFISYTNTFFFKGRKGGNYKAQVYSVGRNGTQSRATSLEFFVSEDVMLLGGAKNDFNTIGTRISVDFYFTEGHVVFAWPAFTLDRLIGSSTTGNTDATVSLYRSEKGATFDTAVLLESIGMYSATESATNLDSTALGGGILRPNLTSPAAEDPEFVRGTTFETAQMVMFSPISVDDTTKNKEWTLWLDVTGRELEDDVASLALTLWSANEGESDQIPSQTEDPEPPIVTKDKKCIELHLDNIGLDSTGNADEYIRGRIGGENFRTIGDVWTFAMWIKWIAWPKDAQTSVVMDSFSYQNDLAERRFNQIRLEIFRGAWPGGGSEGVIRTTVSLGGGRTGPLDLTPDTGQWIKTDRFGGTNLPKIPYDPADQQQDPVPGTPPGQFNFPPAVWKLGLDDWWLFIMDYDVTNGLTVYRPDDGGAISPDVGGNSTAGLSPPPNFDDGRDVVWGTGAGNIYSTSSPFDYDGPTANGNNHAICRLHSAGLWNRKLTLSERLYIYNGGEGYSIHWLTNTAPDASPYAYLAAGNLSHYWQFGAESSELQYVARDTGINPLGSGGGDGDIDCSDDGEIAQNFSIAQNVVDDYPGA